MEVTKVEQSSYIKIAFLRGCNARECHAELQQALGNRSLPYRTVARWVGAFKEGRESTGHLPRSGRSVSANKDVSVAVVEQCLVEDRRWIVLELAQHTGIPASSVHLILWQDLNVKKLAAKWVPHHLTEVQNCTRYEMCRINLSTPSMATNCGQRRRLF